MKKRRRLAETLWNLWCIGTIVGIWPRFIEPKLIRRSKLTLPIKDLPKNLEGLRIVHFSDLHLSPQVSDRFLDRLTKKINALSPDIVLFTGDFIDYSTLNDPQRLQKVLSSIEARLGCYASFGNHDYARYVSIDSSGNYDVKSSKRSGIIGGFNRLLTKTTLSGQATDAAKAVPFHEELLSLLKKTPFTLLHNETTQIDLNGDRLNLCGLGDYMLGRCLPQEAFKTYDKNAPGIILSHNPDTLQTLKDYPGNIILCGHTHGGAVMLPGIRRRIILLENPQFVRGKFTIGDKTAYVNRGIGSTIPFRWFASPEILLLTLESS